MNAPAGESPSQAVIDATAAVHPWWAIWVRSRCEKVAAESLRAKGYEIFLPLYRSRRQWSDRVKVIEQPLFPGYIFSRLDIRARLPVLQTPGVVSFVGASGEPEPVDDFEIRAIREIVESGMPVGPWPYLKEGQQVEISHGPLKGLRGILTRIKNEYRVVVSISMLQRSVAVEVDRETVRPLL